MIRIVFFGTPSFSAKGLSFFQNSEDIKVVGVVSNHDAKIGRKQIITPTPVKQFALDYNIPVFTPENSGDPLFLDQLKNCNADFFVVISYGKILPQHLLDIPKYGTFNLHFSLLPKYRGASPVQSSILNGEEISGITIFKIVPELDAGDIYLQKEFNIKEKTTIQCLEEMTEIGGKLFVDFIQNFSNYYPIAQDKNNISFCTKIKKEDGFINPNFETAEEIKNKFLAYTPWPGIYSFAENGLRVIWKDIGEIIEDFNFPPNTLFYKNENVYLQTKNKALKIKSIQIEGKTISSARVFPLI